MLWLEITVGDSHRDRRYIIVLVGSVASPWYVHIVQFLKRLGLAVFTWWKYICSLCLTGCTMKPISLMYTHNVTLRKLRRVLVMMLCILQAVPDCQTNHLTIIQLHSWCHHCCPLICVINARFPVIGIQTLLCMCTLLPSNWTIPSEFLMFFVSIIVLVKIIFHRCPAQPFFFSSTNNPGCSQSQG